MDETCFPAFMCMDFLQILISLALAGMLTFVFVGVLYIFNIGPDNKNNSNKE